MSEADELRSELLAITRALRAHLAWQQATGATGLPKAPPRVESTGHPDAVTAVAEPRAVPSAVPAPSAELPPAAGPPAPPQDSRPAPIAPVQPPPAQPAHELPTPPTEPPAPLAASAPPRAPAPAAAAPPATELAPEQRRQRLQVLAEQIRGCQRCALHQGRTQTVFARGTGSSGLCFVGEGPGHDEDLQGFPFVGAAGQLLDRMITAMGLDRDEVYVCNIVKCRPPGNRKPQPDEMAACSGYLAEQLELVAPQVIVALGSTAIQGLFGTTEGIMRLRGKWKLYKGRVAVMPTFHPAYLLRTPSAKRDVWEDLQLVLKQMGRSVPGKR